MIKKQAPALIETIHSFEKRKLSLSQLSKALKPWLSPVCVTPAWPIAHVNHHDIMTVSCLCDSILVNASCHSSEITGKPFWTRKSLWFFMHEKISEKWLSWISLNAICQGLFYCKIGVSDTTEPPFFPMFIWQAINFANFTHPQVSTANLISWLPLHQKKYINIYQYPYLISSMYF